VAGGEGGGRVALESVRDNRKGLREGCLVEGGTSGKWGRKRMEGKLQEDMKRR